MVGMERPIFVGRLDISFSSQYVLLYSVNVSAAFHSDALDVRKEFQTSKYSNHELAKTKNLALTGDVNSVTRNPLIDWIETISSHFSQLNFLLHYSRSGSH